MLGTVSDEKLVARALAGSNNAWQKPVKRYELRVYNYALRMVGHPDDAADLMQEVFMAFTVTCPDFAATAFLPRGCFVLQAFAAQTI